MADAGTVPILIDLSYFYSLPVDGRDKALLFYTDGIVRFQHRCDRGERGVILCAPSLQLGGGGHTITTRDPVLNPQPVTVDPSILCPDCGTHGWIRNGGWQPNG